MNTFNEQWLLLSPRDVFATPSPRLTENVEVSKTHNHNNAINLNGRCIFCFDTDTVSLPQIRLEDEYTDSRLSEESFQNIWPYIQPQWGENVENNQPDPLFVTGENVISKLPPTCISCQTELEKIGVLHKEIVAVKNHLQTLLNEAEGISSGIRERLKDSVKFNELLKFLKVSQTPPSNVENTKKLVNRLVKCNNQRLSVPKDGQLMEIPLDDALLDFPRLNIISSTTRTDLSRGDKPPRNEPVSVSAHSPEENNPSNGNSSKGSILETQDEDVNNVNTEGNPAENLLQVAPVMTSSPSLSILDQELPSFDIMDIPSALSSAAPDNIPPIISSPIRIGLNRGESPDYESISDPDTPVESFNTQWTQREDLDSDIQENPTKDVFIGEAESIQEVAEVSVPSLDQNLSPLDIPSKSSSSAPATSHSILSPITVAETGSGSITNEHFDSDKFNSDLEENDSSDEITRWALDEIKEEEESPLQNDFNDEDENMQSAPNPIAPQSRMIMLDLPSYDICNTGPPSALCSAAPESVSPNVSSPVSTDFNTDEPPRYEIVFAHSADHVYLNPDENVTIHWAPDEDGNKQWTTLQSAFDGQGQMIQYISASGSPDNLYNEKDQSMPTPIHPTIPILPPGQNVCSDQVQSMQSTPASSPEKKDFDDQSLCIQVAPASPPKRNIETVESIQISAVPTPVRVSKNRKSKKVVWDKKSEQEVAAPTPPKKRKPTNAMSNNNKYIKVCWICEEKVDLPELYNHLRHHLGEYAFKCPNVKCNYAYMSRWSQKYYDHLRRNKECHLAATGNLSLSARNIVKVCQTCGQEFYNMRTLLVHLKKHETVEKHCPCPYPGCDAKFTVRQSVECHLFTNHDESKLKFDVQRRLRPCHICSEKVSKEEMGEHLKSVHSFQDTLQCAKCPLVFGSRMDLLDHVVSHVRLGISCDICEGSGVLYYTSQALRQHFFTQHNIGTEKRCGRGTCTYVGFTESNLRDHIFKCHSDKRGKHQCHICPDQPSFPDLTALIMHNVGYHGAKPKQCSYCMATFTNYRALIKHHRMHRARDRKRLLCKTCQKFFKSEEALALHKKTHSTEEEKPYCCSRCVKTFSSIQAVRKHEDTEHFGRIFICDICGLGFKELKTLQNHVRTHTGERPFSCGLCGNMFRQQSSYYAHVKNHLTKDDFEPGKTFDRKKNKT